MEIDADDGVYVDLFAASSVKFPVGKETMSLDMVTSFPYDPGIKLIVSVNEPVSSKIRIRIPSWVAKNVNINVNGKRAVSGKPGTYVTLSRIWKNNDEISFSVPMSFRMTRYNGEEQDLVFDRYALEYGPLLLAYVSMRDQKDHILLPVSPARLIKSLRPVAGKPLHFSIDGNTDFEYMPYFEVNDETFSCYPFAGLKK
jgi:DUF1680 family protein